MQFPFQCPFTGLYSFTILTFPLKLNLCFFSVMKTVIEYKDISVSTCQKSTFLLEKMDSPMLRVEPGKFNLSPPFLNRIFQEIQNFYLPAEKNGLTHAEGRAR